MLLLEKIPQSKSFIPFEEESSWYELRCRRAMDSSGLKASGVNYGYLTVEDTPGTYNYNPSNKLYKIVWYLKDPTTRRGYYAKLHIRDDFTLGQL